MTVSWRNSKLKNIFKKINDWENNMIMELWMLSSMSNVSYYHKDK